MMKKEEKEEGEGVGEKEWKKGREEEREGDIKNGSIPPQELISRLDNGSWCFFPLSLNTAVIYFQADTPENHY